MLKISQFFASTTPPGCWQTWRRRFYTRRFETPQVQHSLLRIPVMRVAVATALTTCVLYDGYINDFTYCGASQRCLRSVKTALQIALDYLLLEWKQDVENYDVHLANVHQKSAKRLLDTCLRNGGLYIKVGQGVAAINHILPKEYIDTLSLLQDKCLPTSRQDVEKVFLEEFGEKPEHLFEEFNYEPVAAASLAQVFKAKLKGGEHVAVKVQYADLQNRFSSDLGTIIFLQDIFEIFFKNYNFGWILRDLYKNLLQEMNFYQEGRNAEECAKGLQKLKYVSVPKVHWEFTKQRVLTMEWIDGFKISDVQRIKENKLDFADIDIKLFTVFAEQIFSSGFVHADPHPGNVFLRKNHKTGRAEIVLLDHGLYENLPEQFRRPLCEFWEATVLRDEKKMEKAANAMHVKDYMRFAEVLFQQPIRIQGGIKTKLTEAEIKHMQKIAKDHFDSIMNTLKEMPRNMLFIVRNLNTIRAIGRHHGDIVDRPRLMARYAQQCIHERCNTVMGYALYFCRRFLFEYYIWSANFKLKCLNLYFIVLYKLGRAPESAKTILDDVMRQSVEASY